MFSPGQRVECTAFEPGHAMLGEQGTVELMEEDVVYVQMDNSEKNLWPEGMSPCKKPCTLFYTSELKVI